jgi:hypothetical protein
MRGLTRAELVAFSLLLPPALELFSATRVFRTIERLQPRRGARTDPALLAAAIDKVLLRLPLIWRRTCLRRSAVLVALLRREGCDARVVIGVRRSEDGALEAHAWVRCDGEEPFLEDAPERAFAVLRPASDARN